MRSGKNILTAIFLVGSLCCGSAYAQYNSGTTPRGNSGASKAIKKHPIVGKQSNSTSVKTPPVTTTQSGTKTTNAKKPATNPQKTASVKTSPGKVKTSKSEQETASTNTVTVTKKVERTYDYQNAFGIRAGQTSGLTFKHFFSSNEAVEGIVGFWPNAVGVTGLYEKYVPSENVAGFSWYFGGGGHMSFSTNRLYYVYHEGRYMSYRSTYPGFGVGIDGIVGAEYKIPTVPFAISFDIKPFIEVNGSGVIFTAFDPGLGIKFTFK